jgi:hypothetical protein
MLHQLQGIENATHNTIFTAAKSSFTFQKYCGLHFQFHRAHYYLWKGKETPFIPPEVGRAAEASQSLFSYTDGKIRNGYGEDGCGKKVVGTERLILTLHLPYETYHDVKKTHT